MKVDIWKTAKLGESIDVDFPVYTKSQCDEDAYTFNRLDADGYFISIFVDARGEAGKIFEIERSTVDMAGHVDASYFPDPIGPLGSACTEVQFRAALDELAAVVSECRCRLDGSDVSLCGLITQICMDKQDHGYEV